ncbi:MULTISPECIES: carbon-nitrogen hydrolase family protein [Burkholderia cepacia complex]|nr:MULTISPECIES: conjugal transfer protein TraB [Burkholderia cepacia complex]MDN7669358.1 conjugal transfer protein TraB [Burkholderia vietnamiensis]
MLTIMHKSRSRLLFQTIGAIRNGSHHLLAFSAGIIIALLAWYPGHFPITLLALPALWSRLPNRVAAFTLWTTYYLVGARDIPAVCERFFVGYQELNPGTAVAVGTAFWSLQAAVLALPWTVLKAERTASGFSYACRASLATLIVTAPPLGIIGWLSPIHVAGTLYPGWRVTGMGLGLAALCTASIPPRRSAAWVTCIATLAGLALYANWQEPPQSPPAGWRAVDTMLGRFDQSSYPSLYARTMQLQSIVERSFADGASVAILPEEIAGLWRPAMKLWWRADIERMRAAGQTLVIGMDLTVNVSPFRYTDSTLITGVGRGRLDSRQPVPVAMWRPGGRISAIRGDINQPYLMIAGHRAAMSLCFEDLLWWPHWRTLLDKPDVIVSQSNGWFDSDLALANIQRQSIEAVARLAGAPLLRATNR